MKTDYLTQPFSNCESAPDGVKPMKVVDDVKLGLRRIEFQCPQVSNR